MILITGGMASGKRTYARSLGYSSEQIADAVLDGRPVVCNAQELAANCSGSLEELAGLLAQKDVVICTEQGCGLVPAEAEQRLQRERAGRLAVLLAQRASRVVRMVCGIPQVLKEE